MGELDLSGLHININRFPRNTTEVSDKVLVTSNPQYIHLEWYMYLTKKIRIQTFYNHVQNLKQIFLNACAAYDRYSGGRLKKILKNEAISLPNRTGRQPTYLIQLLKKLASYKYAEFSCILFVV